MLLGGLWHGASYNFIIWGFFHGMFLVGQRIFRVSGTDVVPASGHVIKILKIISVYTLVCFAWVFFRSEDFFTAVTYLSGILEWRDASPENIKNKFFVLKGLILIIFVIGIDALFSNRRRLVRMIRTIWGVPVSLALLICAIQLFGVFESKSFIYFQF